LRPWPCERPAMCLMLIVYAVNNDQQKHDGCKSVCALVRFDDM
jgi:hypothetical protein